MNPKILMSHTSRLPLTILVAGLVLMAAVTVNAGVAHAAGCSPGPNDAALSEHINFQGRCSVRSIGA